MTGQLPESGHSWLDPGVPYTCIATFPSNCIEWALCWAHRYENPGKRGCPLSSGLTQQGKWQHMEGTGLYCKVFPVSGICLQACKVFFQFVAATSLPPGGRKPCGRAHCLLPHSPVSRLLSTELSSAAQTPGTRRRQWAVPTAAAIQPDIRGASGAVAEVALRWATRAYPPLRGSLRSQA